MERGVRRHGCERGASSEATAGGERTVEEAGCRSQSGQRLLAVGDLKKLAEFAVSSAEVQRLKAEFATSERHAFELMSIPRFELPIPEPTGR